MPKAAIKSLDVCSNNLSYKLLEKGFVFSRVVGVQPVLLKLDPFTEFCRTSNSISKGCRTAFHGCF